MSIYTDYFAHGNGCTVLWCLCLCVCLCVCLSVGISPEPHAWSLPNILWLAILLTSLWYVMYFQFCGWHHFFL